MTNLRIMKIDDKLIYTLNEKQNYPSYTFKVFVKKFLSKPMRVCIYKTWIRQWTLR